MPRRRHHRHHRLEWTNSMQSQITLIDQPQHLAYSPPASAPATATAPGSESRVPTRPRGISAAAAASTFGADTFAADIRPVQIRASSQLQSPPLLAANARRATRTQTLPVPDSATSSTTTATTTGAAATGSGDVADSTRWVSKAPAGFMRRAKETLKRQLRSLGNSIRHLPDGSIGAEGYYHSVSLN
ncbi:hypothetical protein H4R99_004869 [Coemansia sp. RSA 1722]|nr:hypothetical protein H4R99_004869 [Coemansia sp. RSA 1722]